MKRFRAISIQKTTRNHQYPKPSTYPAFNLHLLHDRHSLSLSARTSHERTSKLRNRLAGRTLLLLIRTDPDRTPMKGCTSDGSKTRPERIRPGRRLPARLRSIEREACIEKKDPAELISKFTDSSCTVGLVLMALHLGANREKRGRHRNQLLSILREHSRVQFSV